MARLCGDASLAFVESAMMVRYEYFDSPLGQLLLTANEGSLTGLHFVDEKYYPGVCSEWRRDGDAAIIRSTRMQLNEYFSGQRTSFAVPLAPQGTEFQRQVWTMLTTLRYGETVSYSNLAQRLGNTKAVRAVGAANGRNPISIIIPCHRVIGADGSLTGYAGGLKRKEFLLRLECERLKFQLTP
jgi:methylated-DNA-[protein]-cysteine S-methyltransferase